MSVHRRWRKALPFAAVVLLLGITASCTVVSSEITGPGTQATSWGPDLAAQGYVEHEFRLSGVASSYSPIGTLGVDGHWKAKRATQAGYTTRLFVRRPADPAKFNGTVIVEWLNVSAGFDTDATFLQSHDEQFREGYAYVGVSVQKRGVDTLRSADRYKDLFHPGDAYSYDIFTQAARALRGHKGVDPLAGLAPRRLIAAGESQSAARMVTYIDAINPRVHAFDGFFILSRLAGAAPLNDTTAMPTAPLIRADGPEPILDLQTEGDLVVLRSHTAHQPDSRQFRLWEVAGGSHADEHTLSRNSPPDASTPGSLCTYRLNSNRTYFVVEAAIRALRHWVNGGAPPAHAPRLEIGDPAAADPLVRDRFGLARGGIRLPQIDVPTATIDGIANPPAPGSPALFQTFCALFGRTTPFTDAQLAA
ncbi:MAG: alpha/beta hydrolase domain-containing protein, partial [Actinomycetota bacterium]|nr:alpha/beta hydrolase domain-containing protein [Actinomycetota bacterium]